MLGFQTFTTSGKKGLNYKNVLTFLIHLIFSTSLCHFCLDVQSSWSEAPAVTQVAACLMDDGNRGGWVPAMIRALSWQGLPFQAWAQSHSVDRERWMCWWVGGRMDGWGGDRHETVLWDKTQPVLLCYQFTSWPLHFFALSLNPASNPERLSTCWPCGVLQGAFTNAGTVEKAMLVNLPLFSSDHHFLLYYSETDISVIFYLFSFFIAQWTEGRKSGRHSNMDGFKLGPLSHLINSSNS